MKPMKLPFLGFSTAVLLTVAFIYSCQKETKDSQKQELVSGAIAKAKVNGALDAPTLSCYSATAASITLTVTAGASGAPAGFSVQWMLKSEYDAYGWPATSEPDVTHPSFCKASFSGVPGASQFNLGPNASVQVTLGDVLFDQVGASSPCENQPLLCSEDYVFRAFAHNVPMGAGKSAFSANQVCSTLECSNSGGGCTYTQGYWKTHGPIPTGNNTNQWDVTSLTLGTVSYTDLQLLQIFNTPAGGNGLLTLAHQLIAAKLNIANGADDADIAATIVAADALIGGLVIPPVGSGSLTPAATSALTTALTDFNEGKTGPGHCGN
jgi:hypothetical protein